MTVERPSSGAISLTAAGYLRDALTAAEAGDRPTATASLMAIDPESWDGIQQRLTTLGGTLPELLDAVRPNH